MVCFQRRATADVITPVPACNNSTDQEDWAGRDFCTVPPVDFLGTGPDTFGRENLPLGRCQGKFSCVVCVSEVTRFPFVCAVDFDKIEIAILLCFLWPTQQLW